jgi:predicted nucleotidyltransferase/DNA-binding XRE family transcriptional regulator
MQHLGDYIRKLRFEKKLPLRTVAAYLEIDQAILSKIERGQRKPGRELVIKLAAYYKVNVDHMLVTWLSDKLVYEIADEEMALQALKLAEEKILYAAKPVLVRNALIDSLHELLQKDGRVSVAWLYGSVARGDNNPESDLDIIVELNEKRKYSMFDLLDLSFILGEKINRKVDLVEKGQLKHFAMQASAQDLIKIYG